MHVYEYQYFCFYKDQIQRKQHATNKPQNNENNYNLCKFQTIRQTAAAASTRATLVNALFLGFLYRNKSLRNCSINLILSVKTYYMHGKFDNMKVCKLCIKYAP